MLNWAQITPAIVGLVGDLAFSGVELDPPFKAQKQDASRHYTHQATQTDVLLSVLSVRQPAGEDDRLYEMQGTAPNQTLHEVLKGDRIVTMNVRVESMRHDDALWAWTTIERIRTRLNRTSSLARLRAVNTALVRTAAAVNLPRPRDGRMLSVASMDLVLCIGFVDVDSTPLNWIERIELTSQVDPLLDSTFTVDASP